MTTEKSAKSKIIILSFDSLELLTGGSQIKSSGCLKGKKLKNRAITYTRQNNSFEKCRKNYVCKNIGIKISS